MKSSLLAIGIVLGIDSSPARAERWVDVGAGELVDVDSISTNGGITSFFERRQHNINGTVVFSPQRMGQYGCTRRVIYDEYVEGRGWIPIPLRAGTMEEVVFNFVCSRAPKPRR